MKEATGELSTTVIAIVAIAAILAIFTVLLLPMLQKQIALTQACNGGSGYQTTTNDGATISCEKATRGSDYTCTFTDTDGTTSTKTCTSK